MDTTPTPLTDSMRQRIADVLAMLGFLGVAVATEVLASDMEPTEKARIMSTASDALDSAIGIVKPYDPTPNGGWINTRINSPAACASVW